MTTVGRRTCDIFVDRSNGQWVVRDENGNFWTIPSTDNPWQDRQPYSLADEAKLESVPGHYKNLLGLPTQ
jgi:hypothetical protein